MKASRHNGRSGKHGVYDVKHNDRDFDVEHSEHIDSERTKQNVYWDCYQGYSFAGSSQERQFNFTEIERAYYYEHYSDFVDAQNERNEQARHPERNRTIDDVLKNNKTCPEETLYQIGTMEQSVPPEVLFQKAEETLLNPVKRTVYVPKEYIGADMLVSGYSALAEYSMLSAPAVECYATDKISQWKNVMTNRLQDSKTQVAVEMWRYDPRILATGHSVDALSLALTLKDDTDERVEQAVEELLSEVWRKIDGRKI